MRPARKLREEGSAEVMNVGCFGKLPIYADFIRYNAGSGEVRILDQWLQEGIHWSRLKLNQKWQQGYTTMPPYGFFLTGPGFKSGLFGVFVPGMDTGGRLFPFSIFTTLQPDDMPLNGMLLPVRYSMFLDQAQSLALEKWKGKDVRALTEEVERLGRLPIPGQTEAESEYLKLKDSLTLEKFWSGMHDRYEKPAERYALIQGLADVLLPLRGSSGASGLSYGVALPLSLSSGPGGLKAGVSFWMDIVFSLLCGDANRSYSFFWSRADADSGILFLFLDTPLPKSFSAFIHPDMDEDSVYDLGKLRLSMVEKLSGKLQGKIKEVMENHASSMTDVINGLKATWT